VTGGTDGMAGARKSIRRVVTGNDERGRSWVLFDGAAPNVEVDHESAPRVTPRARSRARVNTAPSMDRVNLPVKVFCWLG
jgi:hypothetical protein